MLKRVLIWFVLIVALVVVGGILADLGLLDIRRYPYRDIGRQSKVENVPLPETAVLVSLFDRLALLKPDGGMRLHPLKWRGEISVFVAGEAADRHRDHIERTLEQVSDLTGLRHRFVAVPHLANLTLQFVEASDILATAERFLGRPATEILTGEAQPLGMTVGRMNAEGRNSGAMSVIGSNLSDHEVRNTVLHEIMHALGFDNHADKDAPSVIAVPGGEKFRSFTTTDKILIRTLYDPRIRAGDSAEAARAMAPIVIEELVAALKAGGKVDDALGHPNRAKAP